VGGAFYFVIFSRHCAGVGAWVGVCLVGFGGSGGAPKATQRVSLLGSGVGAVRAVG